MNIRDRKTRVVCAWCRKHLLGDPQAPAVSHGICKDCADEMLKEMKQDAVAKDACETSDV